MREEGWRMQIFTDQKTNGSMLVTDYVQKLLSRYCLSLLSDVGTVTFSQCFMWNWFWIKYINTTLFCGIHFWFVFVCFRVQLCSQIESYHEQKTLWCDKICVWCNWLMRTIITMYTDVIGSWYWLEKHVFLYGLSPNNVVYWCIFKHK